MYLTNRYIPCRVNNSYHVFNMMNQSLLEFDKSTYKKIFIEKKIEDLTVDETNILIEYDYLFKNKDDEYDNIKKIFYSLNRDALRKSPNIYMSIYLTDYCNLNCNYCMLSGEMNKRQLNEYTTINIIEFVKNLIEYKESNTLFFSIQFTGGEPFLNFEKMKMIVNGLSSIKTDKKVKYGFIITSNFVNDVSKYVDFLNRYNMSIRVTFVPSFVQDDKFNRYDHNGEDKNKEILENIKRLIDSGYKNKIQIASNVPKSLKSDVIYSSKEEFVDKYVLSEMMKYGIDLNRLTWRIEDIGGVVENKRVEIKNKTFFKRDYIKEMLKFDKIHKVDYKELMTKVFRMFSCCAYREGYNLNIMPNGDVRGLIPAYNNEEFRVGNVGDDIKSISENFFEMKKKAAWQKDEKCRECALITTCFGGCVQEYILQDKDKPSIVCNNKNRAFTKKIELRNYINNFVK